MKTYPLLRIAACLVVTLGLAGSALGQTDRTISYINEDVVINSSSEAGSDGIPDHVGDLVNTTGTVTSIDFRSGYDPDRNDAFPAPFIEVYLQTPGTIEATRLFVSQALEAGYDSSVLVIGNEYAIDYAEIIHVHGVTSLEVLTPSLDITNTGAPNAPIAATPATLATLLSSPEDYEGAFVVVTNVTLTGSNWPNQGGSASVAITDGTSNSILRVDSDTNIDGQPAPAGVFTFQGIFTQFDTSDPFNSGYQILPRFYTDILQIGVPASPPTLALTPSTTISAAPGQTVQVDLFASDTNATDTLTFAKTAGPGGGFTSVDDREAVFQWIATGEGSTNTFTFTVSDGALSDTQSVDVVVLSQALADIALNEFQADPAGTITGDANGDGVRDSRQDEFVEIVNRNTSNDQDIGDWTLRIGTNELFTFPAGTILTAETAVVVFGGATTDLDAANFGGAQVFLAHAPAPANTTSNGWFGLSNSGSGGTAPINLNSAGGVPVFSVLYGSGTGNAADNNQSRNLDPDVTGTSYADHETIFGSGGSLYSPGTLVSGTPFPGSGLTNSPPAFDLFDDYVVRIDQASSIAITATDIDGTPLTITLSNAPASSVFTDLGNGSATLDYTGLVADAGTRFDLVFAVSDGAASDTLEVALYVPTQTYSGLIINELMPDPNAGATHIDSNNDGVEDDVADEFIEIVNATAGTVELLDCTLTDASGDGGHTFSALSIPPNGAVVVFGGGSVSNFTASPAQISTRSKLSLNNGGDTISLYDPATNLLDRVTYADPGVPDAASLNRDPDVTGESFSIHSLVGGGAASPGTWADGTSFLTDQPPSIVVSGTPTVRVGELLVLDVTASEPDGDTVTLVSIDLPTNASFTDTNGTGVATSSFRFTPEDGQIGTVVATFIASDPDGATTNKTTITVAEGGADAWDFESGLQGWTTVSQASNRDWNLSTGGGAEGSATFMIINGYQADVACDDWLVSPILDLTALNAPSLTFWVQRGFDGIPANRQFLVSTNYGGDVGLATWDPTLLPDPGGDSWPSPPQSMDLSAYTDSANVTVAFRYESDGPGTTQHDWGVDQIRLADALNTPPLLVVPGPQSAIAGETVSFEVAAFEADGDPITLTQQNKPAAATFVDSGTGTGTFNWVTSATDTGVVTVTFSATDKDGTDTETVDITVTPAPSGDCSLIISEYIEGSSDNKALELFNGTPDEIDLAAGDYHMLIYFNANTSAGRDIALTGTIASGGTYVIANPQAVAAITNLADQFGDVFFNGDDSVEIRSGGATGALVDSIGRPGEDGDDGGWSGDARNHTLVRKSAIREGDMDSTDPFNANTEWNVLAQDTYDGLQAHLSSGCPETIGDGDSDADGVSDADEAIAGTNPGDPNDFFAVVDIAVSGSDLAVTLPTKTTRNYVIQWTTDLSDTNSWQDVNTATGGSGGNDPFLDLAPTNQALFYRGDVRLP